MTEDAIARNILQFVRKLDGEMSEEKIFRSAIARNWLDVRGAPTPEGRQLIHSFGDLGVAKWPE